MTRNTVASVRLLELLCTLFQRASPCVAQGAGVTLSHVALSPAHSQDSCPSQPARVAMVTEKAQTRARAHCSVPALSLHLRRTPRRGARVCAASVGTNSKGPSRGSGLQVIFRGAKSLSLREGSTKEGWELDEAPRLGGQLRCAAF